MWYIHPVPVFPVLRTRHHRPLNLQVTTSNDGECFSTPHRRLKTPRLCSRIFDLSKWLQSRAIAGLRPSFESASYPLSINTRIARKARSKNKQRKRAIT
jgi:hypothetical protein